MNTNAPKHGDERNRHMAKDEPTTLDLTTPDGAVSLSYSSREYTSVERYCGTCETWISCGAGGIWQHMICKVCKTDWKAA